MCMKYKVMQYIVTRDKIKDQRLRRAQAESCKQRCTTAAADDE